jgi:hypothetical protein
MEALGDEADKAFLMGLILIRLTEHRRTQGEQDGLCHLLVVEEAHRLLSNKPKSGGDKSGDPGSKAIETFTNLLAEVRAYGQGLVIADQVPSRLAPEVLKNTNLKIVHRIVAEDDRKAMGETMAMTDVQSRALATFDKKGRAAVFAEGEDSPILIDVKPLKSRLGSVTRDELREAARSWSAGGGATEACCGARDPVVCERGRDAAANTRFRSVVGQVALTLATNPDAAPHVGRDLRIELEAALPCAHDEERADPAGRCMLWHSVDYLTRRRGAQRGWTYSEMREHTTSLDTALVAIMQGHDQDAASAANHYRELAQRLYARQSDPFPGCGMICPQPTCLYRWPVSDAIAEPVLGDALYAAAAPQPEGKADSERAVEAANTFARWLTTLPKSDWNHTETETAWQALDAASRCALQLAVVQSRPGPSSFEHIRALLGDRTS